MKAFLFSVTVVLTSLNAFGQSDADDLHKISYSVFAAGGRSIFRSTIDGPSKFPTAEIRLGGSVTFRIAKQFDVLTRLDFGAKLKRETYNKQRQSYGLFMNLDQMADRTHYFFEVPVLFQYRFLHPKLNVAMGINYRKFFAQEYVQKGGFDTFSSKDEFGVIGRLAYRLNTRFTLGVEYFIALTNIYSAGGNYNGGEFMMETRNEFGQVTLDYKLNFWKKK